MVDGLTLCVAALERNIGKSTFTQEDVLMKMSLELRWMSHSDAKKVFSAMVNAGLLQKRGEFITIAFDTSKVDVPLAFRPSKEIIEQILTSPPVKVCPSPEPQISTSNEEYEDVMPMLMNVAVNAGMDRREFMSKCNQVKKKLNIYIEAAALFVLRDEGIDIGEISETVYKAIAKKKG